MPPVKLSLLSIVLGLVFGLPHIYGVMKPEAYGQALRRFPRSTPVGYLLMCIGTAWFLANLSQESISDFAPFKPFLYALFAMVGLGACMFVKDLLPVRALAVVFLLLGKLMVDSARWIDSEWRLVIVTWAYILVVAGIWFTISPWRLRDLIDWSTASQSRIRMFSAARVGFGLLVVILGLTVFRTAEQSKTATQRSAASGDAGSVRTWVA